ncbi:MAG: BatA and WFA domain-containing protein [Candidatus Altiarchaeota archaeon]|nr:BatA and WFA domain-containing protein [Candidatus Altiarchaeota archaeon]
MEKEVADLSYISNLTTPAALAGLALLIPIILLYLLRPKPKIVNYPSVMFIRFIEKNKRFTSFLERFIQDPILLMQMLIVSMIVLAAANPFYMSEEEMRDTRSVAFVIDASASMQSTDEDPTRFGLAIEKARGLMGQLNPDDEVSIVVASSIPTSLAARAKPKAAQAILDKIAVQDTPSNIGDSMLLAKDMLLSSERKKEIYVLSDFAQSSGVDVLVAKKLAESDGVKVELLKVGKRGYNAGIVSLNAMRSSSNRNQMFLTMTVRNYHPFEYLVEVKITSNDKPLFSTSKALKADSEEFIVATPNITADAQDIRVEILGSDELALDEVAYVRVPQDKTNNVLLLTSEGKNVYLRLMLDSLVSAKKISLAYAVPPVIPDLSGFDVVILGDVSQNSILPGTLRDIENNVKDGGVFVVMGSENIALFGETLWHLMPVDMLGQSDRESDIEVSLEHEMLTDVTFENIVVKKYPNMKERDNNTVTLLRTRESNIPLMSYKKLDKGYIAYVGIDSNPQRSNLYYSSDFPIFWNQMIAYFTKDMSSLSTKSYLTGEYLTLERRLGITTPDGKRVNAAAIYLDKVGVYMINKEDAVEYAPVNLLSSAESNTTVADLENLDEASDFSVKYEKKDVKVETYKQLILVALMFLVVEAVIYRRRGLL